MDAAGQVAQLGDGLLRVAVRGVQQLAGTGIHVLAELLPRQAQLHRHRDEPGLRAVVQVPLDAPQRGGRLVDRVRPAALQVGDARVAGGRAEQRADQQPVRPQHQPYHPGRGQQHQHAAGRYREGAQPRVEEEAADAHAGMLPPLPVMAPGGDLEPDRIAHEHQPVPVEGERQGPGQDAQRELDEEVRQRPPAGRVAESGPDPADQAGPPPYGCRIADPDAERGPRQVPVQRTPAARAEHDRGEYRQAEHDHRQRAERRHEQQVGEARDGQR